MAPPPGPPALGRGVVVTAGGVVPAGWAAAEVVRIDEAVLADPADTVTRLHRAWSQRQPLVVELAVDPARFREPMTVGVEPWTLGPDLELWPDRLHHLVWANTYDARSGEPIWWWGRKAARLGAVESPDGTADVTLPGGRPAWIDGGPRGPLDLADRSADIVHTESIDLGRLTVAPPAGQPTAVLAPDQLAAVAHGSGAARIVAPAGSGKTRVLTERLRHLIVDRGVEPETVLAVAYNKKAQAELEARTADFRPRVRTLNALGYGIVADAWGRRPAVLDEREVRSLVRDLVPKTRRRANTDPLAPYLEALSLVRLGLRDPEEVEAERDDVAGLAAAFDGFRGALRQRGAVDFDEQVYAAVEALLADGALRRRTQSGCRHLLVDELQDLTPAHVLLLRVLAAPGLDVFGVGDDDQVIYDHAGADPGFLIDFDRLFPGAADHPLTINYRCPVAVVDAARTLLSYNHRRVAKDIEPGPAADTDRSSLVVVRHPAEAGARSVVEVVRGWLDDGVAPASMAVLTRVNSLLLGPHVALASAGIPIDSVLRPTVLDRLGLRAALAYLRLGASDDHMAAADIVEILRRPSRGLPPWFAERLERRTWWSADQIEGIGATLPDKDATKVASLVDDLRTVTVAVSRGTTRQALRVIRDDIGLAGAISLLDESKGGEGSSHLDDLEGLLQVADLHPDPVTFEAWLRAALAGGPEGAPERDRSPEGATASGVVLSTVHRVKGMEWDRVAVFGVTAGIVPHRLAADVEEERRVLHVAITRGRHRVTVLADASRPSPFLGELDGSAAHGPPPAVPGPGRRPGLTGAPGDRAKAPRSRAVEARIGTEVVLNGGFAGVVAQVDLEAGEAGVRLESGATLRVRFGETAKVGGREVTLVAPETLTAEAEAAEIALKAWRLERSRADKVAAFIVLSDRHLRGIARAQPTSLAELSKLDGIGPTKLEQYGEEILATLDGLGPAPGARGGDAGSAAP